MEGRTPRLSMGRKIFYAIVIIVAFPIVYFFLARDMRFFKVPSNSMEPTILVADYLMTMSVDAYTRGDIVVVRDPEGNGYLVKRIVALSGDIIEVRGGAVFLDGSYVSEPYRYEPIDYTLSRYRVREGEIFVLGDNSNWSVDSHDWTAGDEDEARTPGGIPAELIVGKVHYIYLPFSRMGKLNSYPLRTIANG